MGNTPSVVKPIVHYSSSTMVVLTPEEIKKILNERQEKAEQCKKSIKEDEISDYAQDQFTQFYGHPRIAQKCYGQWSKDYHCRHLYNFACTEITEREAQQNQRSLTIGEKAVINHKIDNDLEKTRRDKIWNIQYHIKTLFEGSYSSQKIASIIDDTMKDFKIDNSV